MLSAVPIAADLGATRIGASAAVAVAASAMAKALAAMVEAMRPTSRAP
jgi:hypothetical protein